MNPRFCTEEHGVLMATRRAFPSLLARADQVLE
jgi:hypothetical protein